jgi:hypothetical protein
MKKEEIKKVFIEIMEKERVNNFWIEKLEDIEALSMALEEKGLINFEIRAIEKEGDDNWLQVDYYCKKIEATIIIDYDFQQEFKNFDDFFEALKRIKKEIKRIENLIK